MKFLYISMVALVALFANVGCSVEGNPDTGEGVGGAQQGLTITGSGMLPSGTYSIVGTIRVDCATMGGCDGQTQVSTATTVGAPTAAFPALNLGNYMGSVAGAPIGTTIPAYYAGDPLIMTAPPPYCVYDGGAMPRLELQSCEVLGHTPTPIPVLAGTTSTATLNVSFHFSDGVENTLFTEGDLVITLAPSQETVCGESASACSMGQICASLDVAMPTAADQACWSVCSVTWPTMSVPAGGPWGPMTSPCTYPNGCVHAAGLGQTGMFQLGLCMPAP